MFLPPVSWTSQLLKNVQNSDIIFVFLDHCIVSSRFLYNSRSSEHLRNPGLWSVASLRWDNAKCAFHFVGFWKEQPEYSTWLVVTGDSCACVDRALILISKKFMRRASPSPGLHDDIHNLASMAVAKGLTSDAFVVKGLATPSASKG